MVLDEGEDLGEEGVIVCVILSKIRVRMNKVNKLMHDRHEIRIELYSM